jgi:hypothetical protein
VVEVAKELIEPVGCGGILVWVAEVVLPNLCGGIAMGFEKLGDRRVLGLEPHFRARHSNLQQADPVGVLAGDERGTARGTDLLRIVVGEEGTLVSQPVDV